MPHPPGCERIVRGVDLRERAGELVSIGKGTVAHKTRTRSVYGQSLVCGERVTVGKRERAVYDPGGLPTCPPVPSQRDAAERQPRSVSQEGASEAVLGEVGVVEFPDAPGRQGALGIHEGCRQRRQAQRLLVVLCTTLDGLP